MMSWTSRSRMFARAIAFVPCGRIVVAAVLASAPASGLAFAQAPPSALSAALAQVAADDVARINGDTAAWRRVAPDFVFVHSTGEVDDLAAYQRFRARAAAGGAARGGQPPADAAPPVAQLNGDVLVRVRQFGSPAASGSRSSQLRALDVYLRRGSEWHWLAHQTSTARPAWTPVPAADVAEFAGTYTALGGARRTFAVRDGALVQVLGTASTDGAGAATRPLVPLGVASFGYDGLNATVTFVRDGAGRVMRAAESSQVGFIELSRVQP